MEYIVPFVLLIICMVLFEIVYPNKFASKFFFVVFVIYFSILMALRYRVGGDTLAYMSSYSYIPTLDKLELQDLLYTISDPLYVLLCSISKSIHPSFYVFQIIHSIILNVSLSVFLMRYSKMLLFSFVLFLFSNYLYFSTEILRESLAVCVFLFAFKYLFNRMYLKYYLCCIVAFGFHVSAIILFFIPLYMSFNIKTKLYINMLFFLFLLLLKDVVFDFFVQNVLPVNIASKRSIIEEDQEKTLNWIIGSLIRQVIIPFVFVFIYRKVLRKTSWLDDVIILYVFLGIGSVFYQTIFYRFSNYIILFYMLLLSNLFYDIFVVRNRCLFSFLCVSVFVLFFLCLSWRNHMSDYSFIKNGFIRYQIWYPYYSIFDEQMSANREIYIYRRDL